MDKKELLKKMKKFYGNHNLKFPKHIDINATENRKEIVCEISLDTSCVKEKNMQKNCNAFEGWSIVIYTALKSQYEEVTVKLCLKENTDSGKTTEHWARFLYRAQRFSEQYVWFKLSDELNTGMEEFKFNEKGQYLNNIPQNDAGIKDKHNHENITEALLAEGTLLKDIIHNENIFNGEKVYRQLPVGLFKGSVKKENRVFPSSKSAIDLWSWKKDTFYVVELKTLNPMVGIITEIFFYVNYMRDLLIEKTFTLNHENSKEEDRGYSNILENTFTKINGIMLADKFHPVLEEKAKNILSVMNHNGRDDIHYDIASYKLDIHLLQGKTDLS